MYLLAGQRSHFFFWLVKFTNFFERGFKREALIDAMTTGHIQIFLSASMAQAHVFKNYILDLADPIVLPNGARLIFLGTNVRTAQSYSDDLYLDDNFWIPKIQELRKVASGK